LKIVSCYKLKKKEFIITTEDFEEILTQIKEEMRTENAATKEEFEVLTSKLTELKAQMSEAEKERTELKRRFTVHETEQKEVECVQFFVSL
jgi:chromosome segregation ATPase